MGLQFFPRRNKLTETKSDYHLILKKMREKGHRITEQQKSILKVILINQNASIKELFFMARMNNKNISQASVYRTVRKLEDLGFLQRKNIINI